MSQPRLPLTDHIVDVEAQIAPVVAARATHVTASGWPSKLRYLMGDIGQRANPIITWPAGELACVPKPTG
ncbi:MAG: hypothetical protein JO236_21980 [Mycobacterium sp.]|uniref:hypothetical protein n=1 Tax=Mycobacterium sp. TaxID=1785 RepID=UPI001EB59C48|nr:hypothetical protein [Mycobacterium sp.]MBW0020188.1 hypothetical protein [Mycobacterium sp.]